MSNLARSREAGRASLEFLVEAVVVFIPVTTLTVVLWSLSHAQLATEAAARHAARVFVQHTSVSEAIARSQWAAEHALLQYGLTNKTTVSLRCIPQSGCLAPDSWVEVVVTAEVPLVRMPLGTFQATIPVVASATYQVSHYREDP
jgi:hypothetical protein